MTEPDDLASKLLSNDEKSELLPGYNPPRKGLLNTDSRDMTKEKISPLATSGGQMDMEEIKEEEGYKPNKPHLLKKMSSMYSESSGTRDELKRRLQKQKSFNSEMVKMSFENVNFTVT